MEIQEGENSIKSLDMKSKILCVDKRMLPCKLTNLTKEASIGCYNQFLSLFLITSGLTVAQFGFINGICNAFPLIMYPLWGCIIDSISKYRMLLFTFLCMIATALQFWGPWLAKIVSKTEIVIKYSDNTTAVSNLSSLDHSKNYTTHERLLNQHSLFLAFMVNNVIASIFQSGIMCYIEGAIVQSVFAGRSGQSYGEQIVYGPIGFAAGTFMAGVTVDHYIPEHLSRYTAAFYLYLPLSLMQLPFTYILTNQVAKDERKKVVENQGFLVKDVIKVFGKSDNVVFMMTVFIAGLTVTMYEGYLYVYMFHQMNPSKTVMALATVVATISELIIYPFSAKLIKISGSPIRCIVFGMAIFSIRLIILTYCTKPWHVLVNQVLRGLAYSLPWAAMVEHTWSIFPDNATTTALGILNSLHFTASGILTMVLGGYIYHEFGGVILFQGMAAISGSWSLFTLLYFELRRRRNVFVVGAKVECDA